MPDDDGFRPKEPTESLAPPAQIFRQPDSPQRARKVACAKHEDRLEDPLDKSLGNAVYLLNYAAEAGIDVNAETAQIIIGAAKQGNAIWSGNDAGKTFAAISNLAAKVRPVTAETLRACRDDSDRSIRSYKIMSIWLAAIILPLSMISFIYTSLSNSISADLVSANEQIVQLHQQLDPVQPSSTALPPAAALPGLQQFAATMRTIYNRTWQLNFFVLNRIHDPLHEPDISLERESQAVPDCDDKCVMKKLELNLQGGANVAENLQEELRKKTPVYQKVRLFAKSVQEAASVYWGAVTSCLLPVLYALLGACAYVLRAFTEQTKAGTFAHSAATPARFIIAGIGGAVVGLFSNFNLTQGISLSPLAIAFVVGYSADIFFSFLEGAIPHVGVGTTAPTKTAPAEQK